MKTQLDANKQPDQRVRAGRVAVAEQCPHGRLDIMGVVFHQGTQDAVCQLVGAAGGGMGYARRRQVSRPTDRGGCDRVAETIWQSTERRAHAEHQAG